MTERSQLTDIVHQQAAVMDWIIDISKIGQFKEIHQPDLRSVLESFGANFNLSETEKESLKGYSEKQRSKGVKAVWGNKYDSYNQWTKNYIQEYEQQTGKILPSLVRQSNSPSSKEPSRRKNSGMKQFLNDLTCFAAGELSSENFALYTETRIKNGIAWSEGRKNDRVRIPVPNSTKPILVGSFPPEFPQKAFDWLKNN
jgi:hypothetical protein